MKRICSGGIHLEHFANFRCFLTININPACLGVIEIAHRSPARPRAISYFLPQTSLHILSQIIYKIFTLSESNVEHEQTLRCWFKPKGGKFEGLNQATIYEVDYLSTINAISRQSVWMPRNNPVCFSSLNQ